MLLNPKEETEHLDYACNEMFGHSDWEYVDPKLLRRHDIDIYRLVLFNLEETRQEILEEV